MPEIAPELSRIKGVITQWFGKVESRREPQDPFDKLLTRIERWSFTDWEKPEYIGPEGQALDLKKRVGNEWITVSVSRYLNAVNITMTKKDGIGYYKNLFRELHKDERDKTTYIYSTDAGRIVKDQEDDRYTRSVPDAQAFVDFIAHVREVRSRLVRKHAPSQH